MSVDSSSNAWATYQPTTFDGGPHDGPEDCVLYGSFNPSNPAIHKQDTSSGWWYDFGCSPAAAVVCMTPYINIPNFPSMSGCWGGAGYAATTIERPNDLCLMLLPDEVYNLHEARGACAEHNGLLVYTRNASAQVNLNAWVQAQGTNHAKVWINMQQDDAATDPKSGWTLPTGGSFQGCTLELAVRSRAGRGRSRPGRLARGQWEASGHNQHGWRGGRNLAPR